MQNQPNLKEEDRHPWTVIVREGYVFRRYRTDREPSDVREGLAAELCGGDLDVYEVSATKEPPPEEGQQVDPVTLGWTSISRRTCKAPQSDAS